MEYQLEIIARAARGSRNVIVGYRSGRLDAATLRAAHVASCLHFDRFYAIRACYASRDDEEVTRTEQATWSELFGRDTERGDNRLAIERETDVSDLFVIVALNFRRALPQET